MTPLPEEPRTKFSLLHCHSKLDSRFSFNSEAGNDSNTAIQVDAIHRAVGREVWFHVSHFSRSSWEALFVVICWHCQSLEMELDDCLERFVSIEILLTRAEFHEHQNEKVFVEYP